MAGMRTMWRKSILQGTALVLVTGMLASAQQPEPDYTVTTGAASGEGSLAAAIAAANAATGSTPYVIAINAGLTIQPGAQLFISLSAENTGGLIIQGNNATVDMSQANGGVGDRAFFVAGGNVTFSAMTIANGKAVGGNGVGGGGGGAGLGGGIFVANLASQHVDGYTQAANVTLAGVSFQNNAAVGGNGIASNYTSGGGGGMGGNGGALNFGDDGTIGGGGGGGFGFGADGGSNSAGAPGAFPGGAPGGASMAPSDESPNPGGANGGGGGGAYGYAFGPTGTGQTSGGGGGVGGQSVNTGIYSTNRADGGFGGGGAGTGVNNYGGYGGYGGGGGSAAEGMEDAQASFGGNGGFGGGGGMGLKGTSTTAGTPGKGGFGAGTGYLLDLDGAIPSQPLSFEVSGGGGLGAGGGVFVMEGATLTVTDGSYTQNSTTEGQGYVNGSNYGNDIFLGGNVTYTVSGTNNVSVNLGGAGNTNDPNVSGASADQLAQASGGITKQGTGTLTLTGESYYSGATVVNTGTLAMAAGSKTMGSSSVVVGQNAGDNAVLTFGAGASFSGTGQVILGQNDGATGTIVIAETPGTISFSTITSGAGTGSIQLTPDEGETITYSAPVSGNVNTYQNGPGTTVLMPYAGSGYATALYVQQGTLQVGTQGAIDYWNQLTVQGGTLDLNGYNLSMNGITLSSGTIMSSPYEIYPLLELNSLSTVSGNVNVSLSCGDTFQLTQDGDGTTVLNANNTVQGSYINVLQGELQVAAQNTDMLGQLNGAAQIQIEGTGVFNIEGGQFYRQSGSVSGAQTIIVGVNPGDDAVMEVYGDLLQSGALVLGRNAGSVGTVIVGASAQHFEVSTIAAWGGSGQLIFADALAGTTTYDTQVVDAEITGDLSLTINTTATVVLKGDVTNTYSAGTFIQAGTLQLFYYIGLQPTLLPTDGLLQVEGGTLDLNGNTNVVTGDFVLLSGSVINSQSGASAALSATSMTVEAGSIEVDLAGTSGLVKNGDGTVTLEADTGNTFTGATTINEGTLETTGSAAALGGTSGIQINSTGTLLIGQSDGINDAATLDLNGGSLAMNLAGLADTLGGLTISDDSVLDFNGFAADLTFASLDIAGALAIYNYDAATDFITILSGYATGSLSQISFYSDEGETFLGTAKLDGTSLLVVPEPSGLWLVIMAAGAVLGATRRRRA